MGRKAARAAALRLLYAWEIAGDEVQPTFEMLVEEEHLDEEDQFFIRELLVGVQDKHGEIDENIGTLSSDWRLERMARVDVSVLRLSMYEILYRDDIPESVSINEAVELAKTFSSPESGVFVNGILSSFSKQLAAARAEKTGDGQNEDVDEEDNRS